MNMMADARDATLKAQAQSAAHDHLQVAQPLTRRRSWRRSRPSSCSCMARRPFATRGRRAGGSRRPVRARARRPWRKGDDGVLGNNTTQLRDPDGEQVGGPAAPARLPKSKARNAFRESDAARPRRVLLPHVLDPRRHAPQHRGPGQSDQAHLRHLPRHAHDGHGHRQRLDGHRHHQPAVGAGTGRESVGEGPAADAAVQDHLQPAICRRIRSWAA